MTTLKVRLGIYLDEKVLAKLKKAAKKEKMSVSGFVNKLVEESLKVKKTS